MFMQDLMLDLETLGLNYDAPIISIGAVFFDLQTSTLGAEFYIVIDVASSAEKTVIDADTVKWWMRQSSEAQSIFNDPAAVSLNTGLQSFSAFIHNNCESPKKLRVWGNGCTFDNVLLREAYKANRQAVPWSSFYDRDVRTMVNLAEVLTSQNVKDLVKREGTHHNALDDAKYQAQYVCEAYKLCKN